MPRWHKLWRLSWGERWLLIQALGLLPLTAVAVRVVGFRRWQGALAKFVSETDANKRMDSSLLPQAKATARMVRAAGRHGFYRANCLQQSLSLWWLLRRQGIESDLRIGIRRDASVLEGHAWVELAGVALGETQDSKRAYVVFGHSIVPATVTF